MFDYQNSNEIYKAIENYMYSKILTIKIFVQKHILIVKSVFVIF